MAMTAPTTTASWLHTYLEAHPKIKFACEQLLRFWRFAIYFKWVNTIARWLMTVGGNIAESAFVLCTVYVTITMVAHQLVEWLLPRDVILTLNQISVIAFSILPELILLVAILNVITQWRMVALTRTKSAWVWAILFTVPTIAFVIMTIITLTSFVSINTLDAGTMLRATGAMLVIRCLAGWVYGMVSMLYENIGKASIAHQCQEYLTTITQLKQVIDERDSTITTNATQIDTLLLRVQQLEEELTSARIQMATRRIKSDVVSDESDTLADGSDIHSEKVTSLPKRNTSSTKDSTSPFDAKMSHFKALVKVCLLSGESINVKSLSAEAGISYQTGRNHVKRICEEITAELGRNTEQVPQLVALK
jgi:hypothetical protein